MLNNIMMPTTFHSKNINTKLKVYLMEINNKEKNYFNKLNINKDKWMTGELKRKVAQLLTTN